MGKFLSWMLLFVSFFFAVQALMWNTSDMAWNSTYPFVYSVLACLLGLISTVFSPRKPVYDLVRYFMLAVLAWMAYHVSTKVMIGIIVFAVLLLPFVVSDFLGKGEARRNTAIGIFTVFVGAFCAGATQSEHKKTVFKTMQQKRKAKKAAEKARKEAFRRRCEWVAGWYWD